MDYAATVPYDVLLLGEGGTNGAIIEVDLDSRHMDVLPIRGFWPSVIATSPSNSLYAIQATGGAPDYHIGVFHFDANQWDVKTFPDNPLTGDA